MRLLFLLILFISSNMNAQKEVSIIYVGDPMCSWCYGFSPELSSFVEKWEGQIDLQLVMGGLRPYNKETMTDLKSFLTEHWEQVHQASKQTFKYDILNENIPYDTEPSCRAVVTMRKLAPAKEFDFFKDIQIAFYAENKNPMLSSTYADIAKKHGVDPKKFTELFESEEMKQAIRKDFEFAQSLNARSFPTIIAKKEDQYFLMAQGYVKTQVLNDRIKQLIGS